MIHGMELFYQHKKKEIIFDVYLSFFPFFHLTAAQIFKSGKVPKKLSIVTSKMAGEKHNFFFP